ncbi:MULTISPECIES: DUF2513 domain-containing protein [Bacillus]|uniref:DUF2513 domain-containing protein n=1 Tax=Bacillus altitudinis TaxID=293387 RepID=A0ABV1SAJ9_BACAB|nr:DUF2513 domain-containing protein [Bacillus altitudinis]NOL32722.1 DUF2513 domain-containing protein [Bacillus altitudinis]
MKLNHEIVRNVLLTVEEHIGDRQKVDVNALAKYPLLKEYDIQDINYTVRKLKEANFLNVTITGSKQMEWIEIESLTFQGHEFLENIKGSKVWSETKNKVAKLGSASLTILADVASTVIKKHLNLE